jgi:hypothetical protein
MRKTLGVGVVLVVLGALAWWATSSSEELISPPPPQEVVTSVPVVVEPAAAPATPVVVAAPSTPTPPRELRVHVTRGGRTEVGARVTFKRGTEEIGGTVDVMGDAHLALSPGTWKVTEPEETSVEVTETTTELTLQLRPRSWVRVLVVDEQNQPLAAELELIGDSTTKRVTVAGSGHHQLEVPDQRLTLLAWTSSSDRSATVSVTLPTPEVKLVIEPHFKLTVEVIGRGAGVASVTVRHRLGLESCAVHEGHCEVFVARGEVLGVASAKLGNTLMMGRFTETMTNGPREHTVQLAVAPPISGVVHDDKGTPLVGVSVLVTDWNAKPPRDDRSRTLTASDGSFRLMPSGWEGFKHVSLASPYRTERPVLTALGDAPLDITAIPVAP